MPCNFPTCNNALKMRGLCHKHYKEAMHGKIDASYLKKRERLHVREDDVETLLPYVNENLHYDPSTGVMNWKIARGSRMASRGWAGTILPNGYIQIKLNGKFYYAHRLAFLMMSGRMPNFIDHIDGNGLNNKWENIREVTSSQNSCNIATNNASGFKGARPYRKVDGSLRYRAVFQGKSYGVFDTPEEAHEVYKERAQKVHKEYFNPNVRQPREEADPSLQCIMVDCNEKVYCKGLCQKHYKSHRDRVRKGREPLPTIAGNKKRGKKGSAFYYPKVVYRGKTYHGEPVTNWREVHEANKTLRAKIREEYKATQNPKRYFIEKYIEERQLVKGIKFIVRIRVKGNDYYGGSHNTIEEAREARDNLLKTIEDNTDA